MRQAVLKDQKLMSPVRNLISINLFTNVGGIGAQVEPAQVLNIPKVIRTAELYNIVYNWLGMRVHGTLAAGDSNNSAVVIAVASLGHSIVRRVCLVLS